jgi:hypothetical protein
MRGCDLRGAIVQYCDLSGADLWQTQVDGADFLYSEVSKPKHRCNLDGVTGIDHAVISPYELINGRYDDGKHVKYTKLKPRSKKELALIPERPRCLLVLSDPMGPFQKYEGSEYGNKPSWPRRRLRSPITRFLFGKRFNQPCGTKKKNRREILKSIASGNLGGRLSL